MFPALIGAAASAAGGLFGGGGDSDPGVDNSVRNYRSGETAFGAINIGGQALGRGTTGASSAQGGAAPSCTGIPSWVWITIAGIVGLVFLVKALR